ncbi:MAG: FumA C-terminus/TtdB family hydratase beta subunit [Methanomethylophilus sp.]|nr:FumA C-terminus/TtdB family hydratase beta subunit [Methanomethylophilus sp.]
MKNLYTPLDEKTVRSLKLGEIVNITGPVVTGRDEVHIRALEYLDEGKEVSVCLNEAALYHCGPIMKQNQDGTWSVVAAGPTTSARMNALEPRFIREFKIRAIIGKGGMSKEVAEAMKEVGCVYLAATGGVAVTYAEGLARVTGHDWADLGMPEALWQFQTKSLGPLIVAIDANGNSLYEAVKEKVAENLSKMQ